MPTNLEEIEKSVNRGIMEDGETPRLIYIINVGQEGDGMHVYHFLYSTNDLETIWNEEWAERPACNCAHLQPANEDFQYIKELKTRIELILGQDQCCHTYQDVCDHCVALAAESIDGYEEYPSPCRLILNYGDTLDEVEKKLAQRDLKTRFVNVF